GNVRWKFVGNLARGRKSLPRQIDHARSCVARPLLQDHALQRGESATRHGICLARLVDPPRYADVQGGGPAMMTIVTTVRLKEGAEQEWDNVMRERLAAAKTQAGWIGGQLLRPESQRETRIIVGTWRTKEDWEKWHEDPEFAETRQRLDGLSREEPRHSWHDVVAHVRRAGRSSRGRDTRCRRAAR